MLLKKKKTFDSEIEIKFAFPVDSEYIKFIRLSDTQESYNYDTIYFILEKGPPPKKKNN